MALSTSPRAVARTVRDHGVQALCADVDRFLAAAAQALEPSDFRFLLLRVSSSAQLYLSESGNVAVPIPAFPRKRASGLPDLSAYAAAPPPPASPMLPPLAGQEEEASP